MHTHYQAHTSSSKPHPFPTSRLLHPLFIYNYHNLPSSNTANHLPNIITFIFSFLSYSFLYPRSPYTATVLLAITYPHSSVLTPTSYTASTMSSSPPHFCWRLTGSSHPSYLLQHGHSLCSPMSPVQYSSAI